MDNVDIVLEPMPQPFTIYVAGEPVFRDAISYTDRQGKTTAQKQAIAQARYEEHLQIIEDAQNAEEPAPPEEG